MNIHGSRGRTQQIAPGSTPCPSSQTQASVAVLPDPTTTNCDDAAAEGRFVHVYVDNTDPSRPVTPIPEQIRAAVTPLLRPR